MRTKTLTKILGLYLHSMSLRKVAANGRNIRLIAKNDPRKILPVAYVARTFSISVRLLWKWIALGVISKNTLGLESRMKSGISKGRLSNFLDRLEEAKELFKNTDSFRSMAGRPASAAEKLRCAHSMGNTGQGLKPREYAAKVGVSTSSVVRAIKNSLLPAWKPTPHRYLIGNAQKLKKLKEVRKKPLTPENAQIVQKPRRNPCDGSAKPLRNQNRCTVYL